MNGNVIREFLVGLGFKVDEAGFRRMTSNIQQLTKNAALLAAGIYATAGAIGVAVTKIAKDFETLFYLSQRAGTSAANLTAIQFAFGQIGMSADDASSAIDGLSKAMRENPGIRVLVNSLGVATTGQNGKLRDTADVAVDLLNTLAKMDPMLSSRYAGMLGISEGAVNNVRNNPGELELQRSKSIAAQKRAGVDLNVLAENSRQYMRQIREIWQDIEQIFNRLANDVMAKIRPHLEEFKKWLEDHTPEINALLESQTKHFGVILDDVAKLLLAMDKLITATTGWDVALGLIADGVMVKLFGWIGWVVVAMERLQQLGEWFDKKAAQDTPEQKKERQKWLDENHDWLQKNLPFGPGGKSPASYGGVGLGAGGVSNASYSRITGGGAGHVTPQLAADIEAEVRKQAIAQGIDPDRAVALFRAEGGGFNNVSSAGAIGPGQLLPGTAADLGVNPWNWRENVKGGVMYFAQALRKFGGNYDSAEAAYNAGPNSGRVAKFNETGDRRWLPAETQQYLNNIDANYRAGTRGGSTPASVTQTNNFNINGSNAEQVASAVARRTRENADQIRYGLGSQLA